MLGRLKKMTKPGSPALFVTVRILTLLYGLSGAGLIVSTIWLATKFGYYTYINGIYLGIGILEIMLTVAMFLIRKSVTKMRTSVYQMMTLFVAQLMYALMIYGVGFRMIPVIIPETLQDPNLLEYYKGFLFTTNIYSTAALSIHIALMAVASLYVGSLRSRAFDFDYKFMEQNKEITKMVKQSQIQRQKNYQRISAAKRVREDGNKKSQAKNLKEN